MTQHHFPPIENTQRHRQALYRLGKVPMPAPQLSKGKSEVSLHSTDCANTIRRRITYQWDSPQARRVSTGLLNLRKVRFRPTETTRAGTQGLKHERKTKSVVRVSSRVAFYLGEHSHPTAIVPAQREPQNRFVQRVPLRSVSCLPSQREEH